MRARKYFIAYDLEGGARNFRFNKTGYPEECDGDLIAIGAAFARYDEDTDEVVLIDSLLIPLFRKLKYTVDGEEREAVVVRQKDVKDKNAVIQGPLMLSPIVEFDYTFPMDLVPEAALRDASIFSQRCWTELWSQHVDVLDEISIPEDDPMFNRNRLTREAAAIDMLNKKRIEWEEIAAKHGCERPIILTDTVGYDIGNLEAMMRAYDPSMSDFMHSAKTGKYVGGPICTHSAQAGLLLCIDPEWWLRSKGKDEPKSWTRRIRELYGLPIPMIPHDHNPANDSYVVACEYCDLLRVALGKYTLNESLVEKAGKKRRIV